MLVANHCRLAGDHPQDVAEREEQITAGEEDDRTLGVGESRRVQKVSGERQQGRHEAQRRPQRYPSGGELLLAGRKIRGVTRQGTVVHTGDIPLPCRVGCHEGFLTRALTGARRDGRTWHGSIKRPS